MERSSSLTLVPSLLYPLQIEIWLLKSSEQKVEHHKELTWNPGRNTESYEGEPQDLFLRKCCYSLFSCKNLVIFLKDCTGYLGIQAFLCGEICVSSRGKRVGIYGQLSLLLLRGYGNDDV